MMKVSLELDVNDAKWIKSVILYASIDYKRASRISDEITEQINQQLKS